MSRKGPVPPNTEPTEGDTAERDRVIEGGIDAVNRLRAEMRKAGMTACADALDEAFAHCLRDYMTLKGGEGATPSEDDETDDPKLN